MFNFFHAFTTEVADGVIPRHRFMSAYEQKVEPPDRKWQYLLFAAEPYETIGFKVMINANYAVAKQRSSSFNLVQLQTLIVGSKS